MSSKLMVLIVAVVLLVSVVQAQAYINAPVPVNAFITVGGLDWAWADPCDAFGSTCDSSFMTGLAFQSQFGWHLPTPAEFAVHPVATDFVFAGANVPLNGTDPVSGAYNGYGQAPGDLAVATPYFSSIYLHADYQNGADGLWFDPQNPGTYYYETLVVRDSSPVPEPSTFLLLGIGMAGMGFARRKFKK